MMSPRKNDNGFLTLVFQRSKRNSKRLSEHTENNFRKAIFRPLFWQKFSFPKVHSSQKLTNQKGKLSFHHKFLSSFLLLKNRKQTVKNSISLTITAMNFHNTQELHPIRMYGLLVDLNCQPIIDQNHLGGHAKTLWWTFMAVPGSWEHFVR